MEVNKIYNIDCVQGLKKLADNSVDLFIFSPPYNLRNNKGKTKNLSSAGKWKNYKLSTGYDTYQDAMPHEEYVAWQKEILTECWRGLKDTGAIFYNHKPVIRDGTAILPTEYNPSLPIRQIIIWKRAGGLNFSQSFYLPTHEWIMLFAKKDFRLKSKGSSGIKDVWEIKQEHGSDHPAPFPIQIPDNILETVRDKGLVVDPFMGSGTVAISARKNGSSFIGFEISPEYCQLSQKRYKEHFNEDLEVISG